MSRYVRFSNNEGFLTIGQRQTRMLFLVEGMARFYYMDPGGRELTQCFCTIPGYPLMVNVNTAGSLSGAHAVGKMTALEIPMDKGSALLASSPELMEFYCRTLNQALLYHAEIAVMLRSTTPQQRLQWLCARMPEVMAHAQKRHIASFLGITPRPSAACFPKSPRNRQTPTRFPPCTTPPSFEIPIRCGIRWKSSSFPLPIPNPAQNPSTIGVNNLAGS